MSSSPEESDLISRLRKTISTVKRLTLASEGEVASQTARNFAACEDDPEMEEKGAAYEDAPEIEENDIVAGTSFDQQDHKENTDHQTSMARRPPHARMSMSVTDIRNNVEDTCGGEIGEKRKHLSKECAEASTDFQAESSPSPDMERRASLCEEDLEAQGHTTEPEAPKTGLGKEKKMEYNRSVRHAQECESEGDLRGSLKSYETALEIKPDSLKLVKKIEKLKMLIEEREQALHEVRRQSNLLLHNQRVLDKADEKVGQDVGSELRCEEAEGWVHDKQEDRYTPVGRDDGFSVKGDTFRMLLPYQKQGVLFLSQLDETARGGILGDDMGLGKTCQTVSFIGACMQSFEEFRVLVVAPVSVLSVWEQEFRKFSPNVKPRLFHGTNVKERTYNLNSVARKGGVCLTSYGIATTNSGKLSETEWDYVICDEGHKLKKASIQASKQLRLIPAHHRLLLTGTPLQNNLDELWALYDFVMPGLLGDAVSFKRRYTRVIVDGIDREATETERAKGSARARELRDIIAPFHLARSKKDVFSVENNALQESQPMSQDAKDLQLTATKTEWILWLRPSKFQEKVYRSFLESEQVQNALNTTKSPLAALTVLKKICDHPYLLERKSEDLEEDKQGYVPILLKQWKKGSLMHADTSVVELSTEASPETMLSALASNKLAFTIRLVTDLRDSGHRTLIFSQSVRMLNIIQSCLEEASVTCSRLDGSVKEAADRRTIIDSFNNDTKIQCLLLTTGVGGVGISLVGSDRVIIYDPSWNPATDAQAVDRAFRVGQKKDVVVYRLVTCGTVEEKILRNQIFKKGLHNVVMQQENQQRYFTRQQLRSLFEVGDTRTSKTHEVFEIAHGHQRIENEELKCHRENMQNWCSRVVRGVSDYHLLFSFLEDVRDNESWALHESSPAKTRARGGGGARGGAKKSSKGTKGQPTAVEMAIVEALSRDKQDPVLRSEPIWIDSDDETPPPRQKSPQKSQVLRTPPSSHPPQAHPPQPALVEPAQTSDAYWTPSPEQGTSQQPSPSAFESPLPAEPDQQSTIDVHPSVPREQANAHSTQPLTESRDGLSEVGNQYSYSTPSPATQSSNDSDAGDQSFGTPSSAEPQHSVSPACNSETCDSEPVSHVGAISESPDDSHEPYRTPSPEHTQHRERTSPMACPTSTSPKLCYTPPANTLVHDQGMGQQDFGVSGSPEPEFSTPCGSLDVASSPQQIDIVTTPDQAEQHDQESNGSADVTRHWRVVTPDGVGDDTAMHVGSDGEGSQWGTPSGQDFPNTQSPPRLTGPCKNRFVPTRYRSTLGGDDTEEYNSLIHEAVLIERELQDLPWQREYGKMETALTHYLKALELADDDECLQRKAFSLACALGVLPGGSYVIS